MKGLILALALMLATTPGRATEDTNVSVETLDRLCTQKSKMCDAYFLGVKETLVLAAVTAAPGNQGGWFNQICMPRQGISAHHVATVWQQYLAAHQVSVRAPAIFTVLDAAAWRWPCN